jgi:hypothetical protein
MSDDRLWESLRKQKIIGQEVPIENILFGDEEAVVEALLPTGHVWFEMLVDFYYKSHGVPFISVERDSLRCQTVIGLAYPPRGWRWEGQATKPKASIFFEITDEQIGEATREEIERSVKWGFRAILDQQ